jgi:hypothetical protein
MLQGKLLLSPDIGLSMGRVVPPPTPRARKAPDIKDESTKHKKA